MQTLSPYLIFDGNAAAAFDFYKSVFGGDFSFQMKASDTPPGEGATLDPAEADKLMHICLPLANGQMLQASDMIYSYCPPEARTLTQGNNQFICIRADSEQEARSLFKQLSEGAHIQVDMQPMFWGDLFGSAYGPVWDPVDD